eukprot:scaffold3400_cov169-Amphora_coffeaeformis.AAC.10
MQRHMCVLVGVACNVGGRASSNATQKRQGRLVQAAAAVQTFWWHKKKELAANISASSGTLNTADVWGDHVAQG